MNPEALFSRLLHRDASVLVINKPAGLAVHASGRNDDHLGLYLDQLRFGLPHSPELAHRLDRDTSGCLVLGRHRQALKRLGGLFATGRVEKTYWALVVGSPAEEAGVIDAPLAKLDRRYGWRVRIDASGQPSVTEWRVLARSGRHSLLECHPRTGRTHQIRVHLASRGWPILGDGIYGQGTADLDGTGLCLHSRAVSLPYAAKAPPIAVTAPLPEAFLAAAAGLGLRVAGT